MLGIFFISLVLAWTVVLLTAFCPLRAIRRRQEEAALKAGVGIED